MIYFKVNGLHAGFFCENGSESQCQFKPGFALFLYCSVMDLDSFFILKKLPMIQGIVRPLWLLI
jgi:hypothetical protein